MCGVVPASAYAPDADSRACMPARLIHPFPRTDMGNKTTAAILFVLALVMFVLGVAIRGLPPVVTAIGFVVIGFHILRKAP